MKYTLEPERKPVVNPFASEQIIRAIPVKGIAPLPIVGEQAEQKERFAVVDKTIGQKE